MSCILLIKHLVFLLSNFLEQLSTTDILHDQVYVFFINIRLIVLDNIGVVELGEYVNFFLYCFKVVLQFGFIHHFNGHLMLLIMLVKGKKHFAKGARAEHDRIVVYLIVLLQFSSSLLLL